MSKIDTNVINNIKMLSLDMINEAGSGDCKLALNTTTMLYNLFLNHLNYNKTNPNWINRDRIIVNNKMLPVMYSTLHMFGYNISIDSLREYKKLNSITGGYNNPSTTGIEIGSISTGDIISSAIGIALGERYIESLIKIENPKCELINFYTYCVCTIDDLMSGIAYESLSFASKEKLNKLIILCNKDILNKDCNSRDIYKENLEDRFKSLNFDIIEVKNGNNSSSINEAIDEAKNNKIPTIIIFNTINSKENLIEKSSVLYNKPFSAQNMNNLREKYNIELPFYVDEKNKNELDGIVNKRLNKCISKWNGILSENINDLKIKEIIDFLENRNPKIDFNSDYYKINDNYNEELLTGNSKMFNIFASKSPFILSGSNDNFINTKCSILKSEFMSKDNPLGRNILFGGRTLAMGGIANGLASLGFKMFISAPLSDSIMLKQSIKFSTMFNYPVNYIFTQDNIINSYEDLGINPVDEINSLRLIPNLITIRPCDINEIIGTYEILSNYKRSIAIIIGNEKTPKLNGTNSKYVLAGAYRIRKEQQEANGVLIATGSEVNLALNISEELSQYGIDLRVVSMPSQELFENQNIRYKHMLLPKELKTFVIEFGDKKLWNKYATDEDYIFGISKYGMSGTKEELLNYYNLNKDYIKTKIIELMKS